MSTSKMIIILEKEKINHEIRNKLLKKGLSLNGISDKETIFVKLKRHFHNKIKPETGARV